MTRRLPLFVATTALVASLAAAPPSAHASPRYALVVGIDQGSDPDRPDPIPLQHAENEARAFGVALTQHARLEPDRISTVVGGDRDAVLAAAARLQQLRAEDARLYGELPSLFIFYFTGHGRDGNLLTEGAPLTATDIEAIRTGMGATTMVGVFDTCESAAAIPRGAIAGANPLDALPEHILDAEGTVWIASASAGELALEDRRGGIFTHHFLKAFTEARGNHVGRALTDMFEYARARTVRDAEALRHRQTPRIRLNLERTAPLVLSFQGERPARLVFGEDVAGTFIISYEDGTLVERLVKPAGETREVAAYSGHVKVYRTKGLAASAMPYAEFRLQGGQRALISGATGADFTPAPPQGLRTKGDIGLRVRLDDASQAHARLGLGYGFDLTGDTRLGATHNARLDGWVPFGRWSLGVALGYGRAGQQFDSWGYDEDQVALEVSGGYAVLDGPVRLDAEVAIGGAVHLQGFDDGADRTRPGALGRAGLRLAIPIPSYTPDVVIQVSAGVGTRLSSGIADGDDALGGLVMPYGGVVVALPFAR